MSNAGEPKTAEELETRAEIDWLLAADLGRFIRSRKRFTMPPPFFFDFFAAVDEGWSAMEMMRVGDKQNVTVMNLSLPA